MEKSIIPQNFEEWRHCIVIECGLELTPSFIEERISLLQNDKEYHTKQFTQLYGPEHLQKVIGWFKQAQEML